METTQEKITPAKAEKMLNSNKCNRRLRDGVVEKYTEDMKNGRWTQCPVPISFMDDGTVADGQHRLWAIVESGVPQVFNVTRGLTKEDMLNIDTGLPRNLVDNSRIAGMDPSLSYALIGTARAVEHGVRGSISLSNSTKVMFVVKHREASEFALKYGPRSKFLRNAVMLAAIARAWYKEADKTKLQRFGYVVQTGFSDGIHETAAIAIRNYLLVKGSSASNAALWTDTFYKIQNAIFYFMRGKSLMIIKSLGEEAYPLDQKGFKQSRANFAEKTRINRKTKITAPQPPKEQS
jgi:hypothetical protein